MARGYGLAPADTHRDDNVARTCRSLRTRPFHRPAVYALAGGPASNHTMFCGSSRGRRGMTTLMTVRRHRIRGSIPASTHEGVPISTPPDLAGATYAKAKRILFAHAGLRVEVARKWQHKPPGGPTQRRTRYGRKWPTSGRHPVGELQTSAELGVAV